VISKAVSLWIRAVPALILWGIFLWFILMIALLPAVIQSFCGPWAYCQP
jgi:hypothetical protein